MILARIMRSQLTYKRYLYLKEISRSLATTNAAIPDESTESSPVNDHCYHKLVPWRKGKQLAVHLYENALFENKHLIAINKPNKLARYNYQMPLQLSREDVVPHGSVCLNDAMPHLQKMAGADFLDVTLGVHREASGIVILAKTKRFHESLREYFKIQVRKDKHYLQTFWALTYGVPVPDKRELRLGLQKKKVHDYVITVQTSVSGNEAQRHRGQRPYMKYRTLAKSANSDCALVEVQPTSTRWDSIEVLLTSQLAPILGDHVYSSRVGTVMDKRVALKQSKCPPKVQVLPRQLLDQLNLGRKDAQHVPQHLHSRRLILPKLRNFLDRDIEIVAPLPDYFLQTMNWLDIVAPNGADEN